MKKVLLSLLTLPVLFAACKKNDNTGAPASQRILGSWMMTENKTITSANGKVVGTQDNLAGEQPCGKDDLYTYLADGRIFATEGASKCRTSDPDTINRGRYTLYSNDSKLILKGEDGTPIDTFDIVELSGSTLRFKKDESGTVGGASVVISDQTSFTKK